MHTYDAHGLPYFISSSGVMLFREICYTVVSYAPYILLQNYAITNLATFRVTIFYFISTLAPAKLAGNSYKSVDGFGITTLTKATKLGVTLWTESHRYF